MHLRKTFDFDTNTYAQVHRHKRTVLCAYALAYLLDQHHQQEQQQRMWNVSPRDNIQQLLRFFSCFFVLPSQHYRLCFFFPSFRLLLAITAFMFTLSIFFSFVRSFYSSFFGAANILSLGGDWADRECSSLKINRHQDPDRQQLRESERERMVPFS